MIDFRKIIIILVIAILFAVLVFSTIEAVYPQPKYEDYCNTRNYPLTKEGSPQAEKCATLDIAPTEYQSCDEKKGYISYTYDSNGCAISYVCDTCNVNFQKAQDQYNQYVFYISAVLALIAIFVGLYLPAAANPLNEWIGTGFLLGGAFALFFGTIRSFNALDRYIRPAVILLELILVIFLAYKKIDNLRKK